MIARVIKLVGRIEKFKEQEFKLNDGDLLHTIQCILREYKRRTDISRTIYSNGESSDYVIICRWALVARSYSSVVGVHDCRDLIF